jgi:pimeloyl-ACP methyl ester carboxylesterase
MPIPAIISGALIDIAKKYLFDFGKQTVHDLVTKEKGENLGKLVCYRKEPGYNNVLLFVHGFSGSPTETFGNTPDMLIEDPQFKGWDIYSIGYSSDVLPSIGKGVWSVNPDITKISKYLHTLLQNQFADYDRIAFVGHSMGGLAVQRAIVDLTEPELHKLSHVLFFGTPSAGLKKAFWFSFWNTQTRDLSSESTFVKSLRADWSNRFKDGYNFVFKTIAGTKDEFVPVDSSLKPFEEKFTGIIEGNHITMVKPVNKDDESFQLILKTLTGQHITNLSGNPEDVNLLLGKYQTVINKFLPNAQLIGTRELTQLVFALESTDQAAKAMEVLNGYPKASSDSDLLGIIGGRHKRAYLANGLQSNLDQAFEYYQKALSLSQTQQDNKQIFYHAINLAFLSILSRKDADMTRYAQMALDHCTSAVKDVWEIATIAESNMYLGNQDVAMEYYRKAAEAAGAEVRIKQSIYGNAFYGYQSLMATTDKNAAFLKFLEELFL